MNIKTIKITSILLVILTLLGNIIPAQNAPSYNPVMPLSDIEVEENVID